MVYRQFGLLAFLVVTSAGLVCSGPTLAAEVSQETYAIKGATGIELYESIGRNGPKGAIAQTRYTLTWKRLFDEERGDCRLIRFEPVLAVSVISPKPSNRLDAALHRKWNRFIAGIAVHEAVHVKFIDELVDATKKAVAGTEVKNDRTCAKVKKEVSRRIQEQMDLHKQRNREFEQRELSDGGNVHRLILELVN